MFLFTVISADTGEVGVFLAKVDKHAMVVGAARYDGEAAGDEGLGKGLGILLHLCLVLLVLGLQGFAEGYGLGGDDMLERSALDAGEYG